MSTIQNKRNELIEAQTKAREKAAKERKLISGLSTYIKLLREILLQLEMTAPSENCIAIVTLRNEEVGNVEEKYTYVMEQGQKPIELSDVLIGEALQLAQDLIDTEFKISFKLSGQQPIKKGPIILMLNMIVTL